MKTLQRSVSQLVLASLLALPGFAQTAAQPTAASPTLTEPEIITLSPFTINAEEDTGYTAKEDLSGSRMRLSLEDVSIPMDIITPELMEDFNINQQEDLFNIVSNMEDRNDNFLSGVYESGASYSIRGFVSVKSLRNFIAGNMPFDRYNSSRVIASKGPNAILYGSGAGGGSFSFFTNRYNLESNRDRTNVRFSADSLGSLRGEITVNQSLIDNKLGFNFSAFKDHKKFYIEPSYEDRDGYYLSVAFKPFKNTTINAAYEKRTDHVYRAASDYTTLTDYYSAWDGFGTPSVIAPLTGNTGKMWLNNAPLTADVRNYGLARQSAHNLVIIDGQVYDTFNTAVTDRPSTANSPQGQRSLRVAPWPKESNPTGLNGGAEARSDAIDVTIEQKITDDFYVTGAFGKIDSTRLQFQHRVRELREDANYYLPGTTKLNPHFSDYYLELGNYSFFDRATDTKTVTLMAAYLLDLEKRNKFLGKHNFSALWQRFDELNANIRQTMLLQKKPDPSYTLTNVNDASGRLAIREYIGSPASGGSIPDYRYIQSEGYQNGGYEWGTEEGVGGSGWRSYETTSKMFVMQSSWLRNRIITNIGYRTESVDQYIVNFANNPAMQNRQTAYEHYTKAQSEDPTYVKVLTNEVRPSSLPSIPWENVTGLAKNLGLIVKVTPKIALIANKSQNISGSAGRNGVFGIALPNSDGKSFDVGMRFNLFDNRIRLEYTRYKTEVTNQAVQATGGSIRVPYEQARDLWEMMIQAGSGKTDPFLDSENWDVRDFVSKGHEITISGDPIPGMSLRLAIAYNEQEASNLGGTFMPWWNENKADIEAFKTAHPNAINLIDTDSTPDPASAQWEGALNMLKLRDDLEGLPTLNRPLWTAKFVGKYSFREGALRGHETGINVAWRGKQKSNYFQLADGSSDTNDPFYTESTTVVNVFWNYSKKLKIANKPVTWKFQLNINNLFNNYLTLDTNFYNLVDGDKDSEVISVGYRRADPRLFSMTNSFSF